MSTQANVSPFTCLNLNPVAPTHGQLGQGRFRWSFPWRVGSVKEAVLSLMVAAPRAELFLK